jgi:ABC-2 type transport system permease protein
MLYDIATVFWKEAKVTFRFQENINKQLLSFLGPIMLAVLLPLDYGSGWVENYSSILLVLAIPLVIIGSLVPSSFAGEKERHTLETLLASRLSDQAILLGKSIFIILYGWIITQVILSFSLITVNLTSGVNEILFYQVDVLLVNMILSLLISSVVCSAGILISLRSDTVQEASQRLMSMLLVPPSLLGALVLLLGLRPKVVLSAYEPWQILIAFSGVLVLIITVLFMAARWGFRRSNLIAGN